MRNDNDMRIFNIRLNTKFIIFLWYPYCNSLPITINLYCILVVAGGAQKQILLLFRICKTKYYQNASSFGNLSCIPSSYQFNLLKLKIT